ncbi:MAG: CSLREA domain-containing protein, partial [Deltaproteobacteria bacterium]|nr:CSLREA domain-containing protein [Deltaproteobacteria bacterium]
MASKRSGGTTMAHNMRTHALGKGSVLLGMVALVVGLWLGQGLAPVAYAATFTVNSTDDAVDASPGDGFCDTGRLAPPAPASPECTLRAAIQEANALPGDDEISLPAGTYVLSAPSVCAFVSAFGGFFSEVANLLCVRSNLSITGAGADTTIIDGNHLDRVIWVGSGVTASISGVTVTHGVQRGGSFIGGGAGILNHGTLTLAESVVRQNSADVGGGGITNIGTLTLTNSVVSSNSTGGDGGGINNLHTGPFGATSVGTLTLINSTISDNNSTGGFIRSGGGIITNNSSVTITGSTISGNSTGGDGGGIADGGGTLLTLTNSTISGNTAFTGGGINNACSIAFCSTVNLNNVTIANNVANVGGGISNGANQIINLKNTLSAGNTASSGPDCAALAPGELTSQGYNLIQNTASCIILNRDFSII